jgi:tRNA (cmo5U34)-methyltransferase
MSAPNPAERFGEDQAAVYDQHADRLGPFRKALHLCLRGVMASLPLDAHIACVGAGTGAELLTLAEANPGWRFSAIDPAPAMLARCRQRAEAAGIVDRCAFHEGTMDTLEPATPFDGATAILVSHFLVDTRARRQFFVDIARQLRPGGLLVACDLATELGSPTFDSLYDVWEATLTRVGFPVRREVFGTAVGMLSPQSVERLIASSGFDAPVPFFQTLFMHAWYARRSAAP